MAVDENKALCSLTVVLLSVCSLIVSLKFTKKLNAIHERQSLKTHKFSLWAVRRIFVSSGGK